MTRHAHALPTRIPVPIQGMPEALEYVSELQQKEFDYPIEEPAANCE